MEEKVYNKVCHVNKAEFKILFENYFNNRTEENFNKLYPMLRDVLSMVFTRHSANCRNVDFYTKRENRYTNLGKPTANLDLDDLVSTLWQTFFEKILRDYDATKGEPFGICYKYFTNEAMSWWNKTYAVSRSIKNTCFIQDMVGEDMELDNLPCIAFEDKEEEIAPITLHTLRQFVLDSDFEYPKCKWEMDFKIKETLDEMFKDEMEYDKFISMFNCRKPLKSLVVPLSRFLQSKNVNVTRDNTYLQETSNNLIYKLGSDFNMNVKKNVKKIKRRYHPVQKTSIEFKSKDRPIGKIIFNNYNAFGETKTLYHWLRDSRCNVSYNCLRHRISVNMDFEKAMSTPAQKNKKPLTVN